MQCKSFMNTKFNLNSDSRKGVLYDQRLASEFLYALAVASELGAHVDFSNGQGEFAISLPYMRIAHSFLKTNWDQHFGPLIQLAKRADLNCVKSPEHMFTYIMKASVAFSPPE